MRYTNFDLNYFETSLNFTDEEASGHLQRSATVQTRSRDNSVTVKHSSKLC